MNLQEDTYPDLWRAERIKEMIEDADKTMYAAMVQGSYIQWVLGEKEKGKVEEELKKVAQFLESKADWKKYLQSKWDALHATKEKEASSK